MMRKQPMLKQPTVRKINDLIAIHNNIAKRKGLRQIPFGTRITFSAIGDRIEFANSAPIKKRGNWLSRLVRFITKGGGQC